MLNKINIKMRQANKKVVTIEITKQRADDQVEVHWDIANYAEIVHVKTVVFNEFENANTLNEIR